MGLWVCVAQEMSQRVLRKLCQQTDCLGFDTDSFALQQAGGEWTGCRFRFDLEEFPKQWSVTAVAERRKQPFLRGHDLCGLDGCCRHGWVGAWRGGWKSEGGWVDGWIGVLIEVEGLV